MTTDGVSRSSGPRPQLRSITIRGTSLLSSSVGLGTHALHRLTSSTARQSLLALAHDLGVRYFDTAPLYGAGLAERELGRFSRRHRSGLVLTTKFGIPAGRLAATIPGWRYAGMAARALAGALGVKRPGGALPRDYSPASALTSVERSLKALGTDHLDILYLHEPALQLLGDPEPLARVLEGMKASGKIRYIGLSGQGADCRQIAHARPSLAEVLQIEVPRGPDGLPTPVRDPEPAAVYFWEFGPGGRGDVQAGHATRALQKASIAAPQSVLLVSTNSEAELRETVAGGEI